MEEETSTASAEDMSGEAEKNILIEDGKQLVVFDLAKEEFGVNIDSVKEIIKMEAITRVPNTSDYIVGVINLRGQIMVVVNLAKKLGLLEKETDKDTRILIIEGEKEQVGVVVDSATEVIKIPKDKIEEAPEIITKKINADYIENVGVLEERLIIMLDLDKLLFRKKEEEQAAKEVGANG